MQFFASLALLAGVVAAQYPSDDPSGVVSTVYSTQYKTITSCGPSVTYCPARSTRVVSSVIAISTTICPDSASSAPLPPPTSKPVAPVCPPIETCTVTVTVPYKPSASPVYPIGTISSVKPSGTGAYKPPTTMFTGAANANNAGLFVAGVGAFAAMLL